jgi:hypothetical protein
MMMIMKGILITEIGTIQSNDRPIVRPFTSPTIQSNILAMLNCDENDCNKSKCDEMKGSSNSGITSYSLVQNVLPFLVLSKNIKITIYKTIILPVVLYGKLDL